MASRSQRAHKPEISQKTRDKSNAQEVKDPPKVTVPWGRSASEYRPGLFTKQYFEKHTEAYAAKVYAALSKEIQRLNAERIQFGDKPFRRPNYSSFSRYFHWFFILGLFERTGRQEPSSLNFLQNRVFYRLTAKGRTEMKAWEDPIEAKHPGAYSR